MHETSLPTHARAVIVGAGIAGCSVAYHLAKLGWRDIVVVDQGPLFETGGSTSHAPGGVFQINASKTMTSFARYTVDLWSEMELDGEPCANPVGSLELAWTPERLVDLKRKHGFGRSWGVNSHVINPQEARESSAYPVGPYFRRSSRPLRHPNHRYQTRRSNGARGDAQRSVVSRWRRSHRIRHHGRTNPRDQHDIWRHQD